MNLEDLIEAKLVGDEPAVPEELRGDFAQAIAAHDALQFALGETFLLSEAELPNRPPPVLPDDYEIVRELGRGGMGVVYLVRQKSLDRLVAVKVLRPGELTFGPLVRRFLEEAKHLARLRHPNVVSVHEVGEAGGEPYFSMDYVEGEPVSELLARERLSPSRALAILKQAAEGVAHAHELGIIHRDLKPSNILIDGSGRAYVSDFGLARNVSQGSDLTHSGAVMGTPQYMAPEQAQGQPHLVGEATDVHALGAILYEMLTSHPPYGRDGAMNVLVRLVHEDPAPPRRLDPRVPRDLETICLKALAKQPAARYATVRSFLEDIRRYETGEPLMARRPGFAHHSRRWLRRYGKLAAAAVVAAAVVLAVGLAVAPRLFDRSVEDLIAWGDEEHVAGKHDDAVRAYQRALGKTTGAEHTQVLERLVRCCGEMDDVKRAVETALELIEESPEASFGKHDYLIVQSLLTQLRSQNENWGWANPLEKDRPLMQLLERRLAICVEHSHLDAIQRREAEEIQSRLRARLAGELLMGSTYDPASVARLPTGTTDELRQIAADQKRSAWERGKAAYAAGLALQESGKLDAALALCREAFNLIRSTFPTYMGVRDGAPMSVKPEDRRIGDEAPECGLLKAIYATLRRMDPSGPENLRGGLRIKLNGVAIPSGVALWPKIMLFDPMVAGAEPNTVLNLPRTFAVETDETAWVGVADGCYRLSVQAFSTSMEPTAENFGQRLEIDWGSLPKEVEIHGNTVELPPVDVWLAEEIQLLEPDPKAAFDLRKDSFRWTEVAGASRYQVTLELIQGSMINWHRETSVPSTSVCLGALPAKVVEGWENRLTAGSTGLWTVEAFDSVGRRIGKSTKNGHLWSRGDWRRSKSHFSHQLELFSRARPRNQWL